MNGQLAEWLLPTSFTDLGVVLPSTTADVASLWFQEMIRAVAVEMKQEPEVLPLWFEQALVGLCFGQQGMTCPTDPKRASYILIGSAIAHLSDQEIILAFNDPEVVGDWQWILWGALMVGAAEQPTLFRALMLQVFLPELCSSPPDRNYWQTKFEAHWGNGHASFGYQSNHLASWCSLAPGVAQIARDYHGQLPTDVQAALLATVNWASRFLAYAAR